MWIDPDAERQDLGQGLFFYCDGPFAYYTDPDGFEEIHRLRAPRLPDYQRLVPTTFEIAQGLFAQIHQRRDWGVQISPDRWTFESEGSEIRTRHGFRRGQRIKLQDVLKHLTGRSWFARGTTDKPIANYHPRADGTMVPNFVPALRFDIDLDRVFRNYNSDRLLRELRSQKRVIEASGLPYRVFRTGSRGVQVVIPLPLSVPPSLASLISEGLKLALAARGSSFVGVDKDNLHGLLRLPGGVHAKTGDLGLWIDVDAGELHSLQEQISLMKSGLTWSERDSSAMSNQEFTRAANDLIRQMRGRGYDLHRLVESDLALTIIEKHSANEIAAAILRSIEEGKRVRREIEVEHERFMSELLGQTESDELISEEAAADQESAMAEQSDHPAGTIEWARLVWDKAYEPGGHWEWINMAGKRGILAAAILFGEDGGEQALLDLSKRIGAITESELRAREHTIRALWRSFELKEHFRPTKTASEKSALVLGDSDEDIEQMVNTVLGRMLEVQAKPRWSWDLARKVVTVLLIGIRDSENGRLRISFGSISNSINQKWPGSNCNRQRVSEMIPRITFADQSLVRAFHRYRGQSWKSISDEYALAAMFKNSALYRQSKARYQSWLEAKEAEFEIEDDHPDESFAEAPEPVSLSFDELVIEPQNP
ncbi:MAG: hypothetical protein JNM28_05830 [Armatimonadetes bacterium]|nr:hypothetical protein [Armatimonadota bacterium]